MEENYKRNKMKIAIIESSQIMTILAISLSEKHEVTLFEKKKIWGRMVIL